MTKRFRDDGRVTTFLHFDPHTSFCMIFWPPEEIISAKVLDDEGFNFHSLNTLDETELLKVAYDEPEPQKSLKKIEDNGLRKRIPHPISSYDDVSRYSINFISHNKCLKINGTTTGMFFHNVERCILHLRPCLDMIKLPSGLFRSTTFNETMLSGVPDSCRHNRLLNSSCSDVPFSSDQHNLVHQMDMKDSCFFGLQPPLLNPENLQMECLTEFSVGFTKSIKSVQEECSPLESNFQGEENSIDQVTQIAIDHELAKIFVPCVHNGSFFTSVSILAEHIMSEKHQRDCKCEPLFPVENNSILDDSKNFSISQRYQGGIFYGMKIRKVESGTNTPIPFAKIIPRVAKLKETSTLASQNEYRFPEIEFLTGFEGSLTVSSVNLRHEWESIFLAFSNKVLSFILFPEDKDGTNSHMEICSFSKSSTQLIHKVVYRIEKIANIFSGRREKTDNLKGLLPTVEKTTSISKNSDDINIERHLIGKNSLVINLSLQLLGIFRDLVSCPSFCQITEATSIVNRFLDMFGAPPPANNDLSFLRKDAMKAFHSNEIVSLSPNSYGSFNSSSIACILRYHSFDLIIFLLKFSKKHLLEFPCAKCTENNSLIKTHFLYNISNSISTSDQENSEDLSGGFTRQLLHFLTLSFLLER